MKSIKFHKKLTLNKKTVAHLDNGQMKNMLGGEPLSIRFCPTWGPGSCPTYCATVNPPELCPPKACL
jgi:hypothetical protein